MFDRKKQYNDYYKVIRLNVRNNECELLKGPEPERKLMRVLENDYNSNRYDKWLQLINCELVSEEEQSRFWERFNSKNLRQLFRSGEHVVSFEYQIEVSGKQQTVQTKIYPEVLEDGELVECMIYVKIVDYCLK